LLADLARRLRLHLGERLERVVLFGSRARGDVTEESDIDALAIDHLRRRERRFAADIDAEGIPL
jgi:predicted nucleotidyltransferase